MRYRRMKVEKVKIGKKLEELVRQMKAGAAGVEERLTSFLAESNNYMLTRCRQTDSSNGSKPRGLRMVIANISQGLWRFRWEYTVNSSSYATTNRISHGSLPSFPSPHHKPKPGKAKRRACSAIEVTIDGDNFIFGPGSGVN